MARSFESSDENHLVLFLITLYVGVLNNNHSNIVELFHNMVDAASGSKNQFNFEEQNFSLHGMIAENVLQIFPSF